MLVSGSMMSSGATHEFLNLGRVLAMRLGSYSQRSDSDVSPSRAILGTPGMLGGEKLTDLHGDGSKQADPEGDKRRISLSGSRYMYMSIYIYVCIYRSTLVCLSYSLTYLHEGLLGSDSRRTCPYQESLGFVTLDIKDAADQYYV